jgi:hypothetical protein
MCELTDTSDERRISLCQVTRTGQHGAVGCVSGRMARMPLLTVALDAEIDIAGEGDHRRGAPSIEQRRRRVAARRASCAEQLDWADWTSPHGVFGYKTPGPMHPGPSVGRPGRRWAVKCWPVSTNVDQN